MSSSPEPAAPRRWSRHVVTGSEIGAELGTPLGSQDGAQFWGLARDETSGAGRTV
jgi:hypothetical protein